MPANKKKNFEKNKDMMTFISFLVAIFGCINWLSIGMLQYDIVAGFFGTQSSIFSRIVYIVIGFAALWLIISTIKQRGKVNIFKDRREATEVRRENPPERAETHFEERNGN